MITRDGNTTSLWQQTISPYRVENDLPADKNYDVVIAGGGITGLSTALLLQQAGKKCIVLEAAGDICFGTTGGTTAHLNTLLDTPYKDIIKNFGLDAAQRIARSATDAIELIRSAIVKYQIDCGFEKCNAYVFSQDPKQTAELTDIFKSLGDVKLPVEYTALTPLPIEFEEAILVRDQAKFHPVRYVHGIALQFERNGGIIKTRCRLTGFTENKDHIDVETECGTFHCSKLIMATHIPPFINILHLRCAPYRSYAMAVKLKGQEYPKDLTYDMYDPYHYYRTQRIDGQDYLIIGGKDHKTAHASNTRASFLNLESHIRTYFDADRIHTWSSQYYESADGIPYIGHLPGSSGNVLVATGFGGNGMIYSQVSAAIFRSMILGEENDLINIFQPSRVKPVAGFKNFAEHNLDVLKHLVTKMFAKEEFRELADLAPGDSKVVKMETQAVGIHKDEHGGLHAVNAACTHMKCTVAWNQAERSWDCPCHGARYSCDGKVLNGPATRDLEYINVELLISDTYPSMSNE